MNHINTQEYMTDEYDEGEILYIVGVDPGTDTGVAVKDLRTDRITELESMAIHNAMDFVESYADMALIIVEDARKWNGYTKGMPFGKMSAKAQGAGSVKRDCSIWDDFLKDREAYYVMVPPAAKGGKIDHGLFKRITGWEGRANQHKRDAAMLILGYSQRDVETIINQINQTK